MKLIDTIAIDPQKRNDKVYIEKKKKVLRDRNIELLLETKTEGEFYLDPWVVELLP
ncbi:MAG TPA: hypothetical protein VM884_11200 [Flavisolibacter sp.]|nr:hypothetical protein [Flavisolibacter sp.]